MANLVKATRDKLNRITALAQKAIDDGELQYDEILRGVLSQVELLSDQLSLRAASPAGDFDCIVASQHHIFASVERHTGVSYAQIAHRTRPQRLVVPRQVVMWALRRFTGMTFVEIAAVAGRRDHSTVVYAIKRVDAERKLAASGTTGMRRAVLSQLVEADIKGTINGTAA